MHTLLIKKSAEKELNRIDTQYTDTIIIKTDALKEDPFPPGCRKLVGSDSSYRIRIGDYRVVYTVDSEEKIITVVSIRHRKDAYKK